MSNKQNSATFTVILLLKNDKHICYWIIIKQDEMVGK